MATEPSASLGLSRRRRIKQARDFARLKTFGKRVVSGCLILNWQGLDPGGISRVGVVTSRKVGGAVLRSRARRLLRESYRVHQHDLRRPLELVLVARPSIATKGLAAVETDLLAAFRRAGLLQDSTGQP
jgi:ribonuclease P protein component